MRTKVGDLILSRFRVEASLGGGAAGPSFRGVDLETDRSVYIKELPADRADLFERFAGETALLADPEHAPVDAEGLERLVRPLASGMQADQPYTVREYLEATSLAERLRQGPLGPDELRTVFGDIARGLAAAHAENLVLRNLKPSNIFLEAGGRARITGLGTGVYLTRTRREGLGVEGGSLRYVAPEQMLDARRVDRGTDLFALGLVLFEALSGQALLRGASVEEIVSSLQTPTPPALPPGDADLAELCLALVEFNPSERPTQARSLLRLLAPWQVDDHGDERCEGCHGPLWEGMSYCHHCGRSIRGPCPHCGRALALGACFCSRCGQNTGAATPGQLVGLAGAFAGEVLPLGDEPLLLGRAPACGLCFEGRDRYVSRHQARLQRRRGRSWLQGGDWTSGRPTTNGTLVNGRNMDGLGEVLLRPGDRLRVGDSFFRYQEAGA